MLDRALQLVESGQDLSMDLMAETLGQIMEGRCAEDQIARLLVALHEKGETVEEVAGAARAMRARMTPIRTRRKGLLDTCGTGGDGSKTFNISTAAAIVTAAAGVPVAKHGNRGITSRSGSADVLTALGVNIEAGVECVEACLDELGLCFCFAPLLHGAMKHVAPVRKKIATPTIFNILGPLVNPAAAEFQLLGVGKPALQPLLAEAMLLLQDKGVGSLYSSLDGKIAPRTIVVHGADGLDEVTLSGPTHVIEAADGRLAHYDWTPADFGLECSSKDPLLIRDAAESAALIRAILSGQPGPPRDIVLANASAALYTAGRTANLREGVALAAEAIDSGEARQLLERLAERSKR
jgi:anthranilate phosphoribosyltransferase